jgi:type I restriction enzyme S subunit
MRVDGDTCWRHVPSKTRSCRSKIIHVGVEASKSLHVQPLSSLRGPANSSGTMIRYPKDTIVFAKSGMSATLGRVYRLPRPAHVVSHLATLVPTGKYDPKFLTYWLRENPPSHLIKDPAYPSIRVSDIEGVEVPAVSLHEQRRISAILNKADTIRRKRKDVLLLADRFLDSVFLEMFGEEEYPGDSKFHQSAENLLESGVLISIQDGNHGGIHPKVKDFEKSGIPFVTANMLRDGFINVLGAHHLSEDWLGRLRIGFAKPRDVLLTHRGSIGFSALVGVDMPHLILSPQVAYYRMDESRLLPEFLLAFFRSKSFRAELDRRSKQSTRSYIGITRQKALQILVPPFEAQERFVKIFRSVESVRSKMKASIEVSENLFSSVSSCAFREGL